MTIITKFSSAGCGKCKMLEPIFRRIAVEYKRDYSISFIDCDVDAYPEKAEQYSITHVPVIVIEYDGHEVDRVNDLVTENNLRRIVAAWAKGGGIH